jgi:hypothetical protein
MRKPNAEVEISGEKNEYTPLYELNWLGLQLVVLGHDGK